MDNPFPVLGEPTCSFRPPCNEGQPVTLLEAMTLGTGSASDLPGNRLIDLDAGAPTSPQDIAPGDPALPILASPRSLRCH